MRHLLTTMLAAMIVMAASAASAHLPYYTQIEKIRFPDGQVGEVRLLHGDGIVYTDPVRPVIVDQQSRLVALGPIAFSMIVSCDKERRCLIVDLWRSRVLELDPASFRQGRVQPAVNRWPMDDLELEYRDENWGFSSRDATFVEMWTANWVMARERRNGLILSGVLTALGVLFIMPISKRRRPVVRAVVALVGSLAFCCFTAVSFWMAVIGGLTFELWIVSVVTGACITWIVAALIKQRGRRQATESASA
jgi:hypothetical protein